MELLVTLISLSATCRLSSRPQGLIDVVSLSRQEEERRRREEEMIHKREVEEQMRRQREEKYRGMGNFMESVSPPPWHQEL